MFLLIILDLTIDEKRLELASAHLLVIRIGRLQVGHVKAEDASFKLSNAIHFIIVRRVRLVRHLVEYSLRL